MAITISECGKGNRSFSSGVCIRTSDYYTNTYGNQTNLLPWVDECTDWEMGWQST